MLSFLLYQSALRVSMDSFPKGKKKKCSLSSKFGVMKASFQLDVWPREFWALSHKTKKRKDVGRPCLTVFLPNLNPTVNTITSLRLPPRVTEDKRVEPVINIYKIKLKKNVRNPKNKKTNSACATTSVNIWLTCSVKVGRRRAPPQPACQSQQQVLPGFGQARENQRAHRRGGEGTSWGPEGEAPPSAPSGSSQVYAGIWGIVL